MRKMLVLFLCFIIFGTSACAEKKYSDDPKTNEIFAPYMKKIQKELKASWTPSKEGASKSATILFTVDRDGKLLASKIAESSGNTTFDEAALKNIRNYKFPPFSPSAKDNKIDILFTYDYNVWGASYYKEKERLKAEKILRVEPEDTELSSYAKQVSAKFFSVWTPPVDKSSENSKASKIVFEIDKEGTVRSKEITLPSWDSNFDKSVDEAVAKVQFPPLPSTYRENSARFTIMFKRDVKF